MLYNRILPIALFLLQAAPAFAGTFCLAGVAMPPQCLYEDVHSCIRAVNANDLTCVVNPDASLSYIGGNRYCQVDANRVAQCLYVDRNECNNANHGGDKLCFDRAIMTDTSNPFRLDPRLQN